MAAGSLLECVVNLSEGRDPELVAEVAGAAGPGLLDVHTDADHNRSVLTLGGPAAAVEAAARAVAARAVDALDLGRHRGAHPRFGVVDVVPFVPLGGDMPGAVAARDAFARWAGDELGLPCFLYGPDRSLPEVRRSAFSGLAPDAGPSRPHATAGACAVGARPMMLAWNLWLDGADMGAARNLAARLRGPQVRALAFDLAGRVQLSFNLLAPLEAGPDRIYAAVTDAGARVARAELVGLAPASLLARTPEELWSRLDLGPDRTIESRLGRVP